MRILLTGNTCFKIANFREGLVRALQADGHEVVVLAPEDSYAPKLKSMGVRLHDLPMDRNGTSPVAELRLLIHIFRFLRRERPDFVFGYTIKNNIYSGLACRVLGIPFIPNVTGLGPAFNGEGFLNRIIRAMYRRAFARAKTVFFQNPDDRNAFLRARLVTDERAKLLPGSGVDLEAFKAQPMHTPAEGVVFLLVARLLWDKGVGLYAEAAQKLRETQPEAKFQVLGPIDDASRSAIPRAQIEEWHEQGLITYLGETHDVRPALAAAHCIVLPSWYREGTPRILLEAAAMGRAVITTDMPGCRDAVEAGVTGFLCAPRSADKLAEAMERFVSLPSTTWESMGRAARERAETYFDEKLVIDAYQAQINRMLK